MSLKNVLMAAAVLLLTTTMGMAQTTVVVLNPSNSFTDEIEPGVTVAKYGGFGAWMGTNLLFSCGACDVATFTDAVSTIGGSAPLCGFNSQIPQLILANDLILCAQSQISFNKYDLELLAHLSQSGPGDGICFDKDSGCSCGAADSFPAYRRKPADPSDFGPLTDAVCTFGAGPTSGCSSSVVTVSDLIAEVNAVPTSFATKKKLINILENVETDLGNADNEGARKSLRHFIDMVIKASKQSLDSESDSDSDSDPDSDSDSDNENRIELADANNLICGAANVLLFIA